MPFWAFLGAAVSAGAALAGANKNAKAIEAANKANRPKAQVRQWEKAGINPVFGLTSGAYVPHQAATVGDAYAHAGAAIQKALNLHHDDVLAETELKKENEKLKEQLAEVVTPREPTNMERYGGLVPLPDQGGANGYVQGAGGAVSGGSGGNGFADDPIVLGEPTLPEKNERALFTLGGINFVGSGNISSGETFETALGESPFSWLAAPAVFGDALGATYINHKWQNDPEWRQKMINRHLWLESENTYDAGANVAPRGYYGPHGSRTGF